MFDWLFGNSSIERVPERVRSSIEKEIYNFCYSLYFAWNISGLAMKQNRLDAQDNLSQAKSHIKLVGSSLENIEKLWPAGKPAFENLRIISNILPDWLLNVRSWHEHVDNFTEDKIPEIDQRKYQHFVLKNRQYADLFRLV